jgi:hypothetical protein
MALFVGYPPGYCGDLSPDDLDGAEAALLWPADGLLPVGWPWLASVHAQFEGHFDAPPPPPDHTAEKRGKKRKAKAGEGGGGLPRGGRSGAAAAAPAGEGEGGRRGGGRSGAAAAMPTHREGTSWAQEALLDALTTALRGLTARDWDKVMAKSNGPSGTAMILALGVTDDPTLKNRSYPTAAEAAEAAASCERCDAAVALLLPAFRAAVGDPDAVLSTVRLIASGPHAPLAPHRDDDNSVACNVTALVCAVRGPGRREDDPMLEVFPDALRAEECVQGEGQEAGCSGLALLGGQTYHMTACGRRRQPHGHWRLEATAADADGKVAAALGALVAAGVVGAVAEGDRLPGTARAWRVQFDPGLPGAAPVPCVLVLRRFAAGAGVQTEEAAQAERDFCVEHGDRLACCATLRASATVLCGTAAMQGRRRTRMEFLVTEEAEGDRPSAEHVSQAAAGLLAASGWCHGDATRDNARVDARGRVVFFDFECMSRP